MMILGSAGKAVGELKVGGKTFRQRGEKGEERKTIRIGGGENKGATRKNITKNFPIKFNNLNPANNPIEVSGNNRRKQNDALKLKDGGGSDTNAKIIIEDVKGGTAQFSDDGRSLICNGSVAVRITLEWDDNPNIMGLLWIVLRLVVKYGEEEEEMVIKLKRLLLMQLNSFLHQEKR